MSSQCIKRLQAELKIIKSNPIEGIEIRPSDNILIWYFVADGGKDTPNEGGKFLGKIWFHQNYPFEPPGICILTPNGSCLAGQSICLSTTFYHKDQWNPSLHASAVIAGLVSEMTNPIRAGVGFIQTSADEMKRLAKLSIEFNQKNEIFQKYFA